MKTLRFRTSDNWEKYHTMEFTDDEVFYMFVAVVIKEKSFKVGDVSLNGNSTTLAKILEQNKEQV
jgi:hypothetical protein